MLCLIFIRYPTQAPLLPVFSDGDACWKAVDCLADLKVVLRKYIQNAKAYVLYNSDIVIQNANHSLSPKKISSSVSFLHLYSPVFSQSHISTIVCKSSYHMLCRHEMQESWVLRTSWWPNEFEPRMHLIIYLSLYLSTTDLTHFPAPHLHFDRLSQTQYWDIEIYLCDFREPVKYYLAEFFR